MAEKDEKQPVKCACGEPAGSNGRECGKCWKARVGSLAFAYHPSKSGG